MVVTPPSPGTTPSAPSPLLPSPGTPGEGQGEGSAPHPEINRDGRYLSPPLLSIILCTHNPRPDLLAEVLDSLKRQTLPPEQFEIIVVDNHSNPPVHFPSPPPNLRLIHEPTLGLNHARRTGILAAKADLLIFIDDDNLPDPDYLETALHLSRENPLLGAYGGLIRGRFDTPRLPRWKRRLLDKLGVRDNGPAPLTSTQDKWGPWEPIGAGLILRRPVADLFVHIMNTVPDAQRLDRSGPTGLMSGGDTLMARCAYRVGLACSYQPSLKLTHVIHSSRFRFKYLLRILHAHGRSVVLLDRVLSLPPRPMSLTELLLRLPYRLLTRGIPGCIIYTWDLGYFLESHSSPTHPKP